MYQIFAMNFQLNNSDKRGFTLLELLIVIGIIAIVTASTIIVVNPAEYFKGSRDTQRIADLNNLHLALTVYYTAGVANFDLDGPNYTGSCASPGKVFISTPSGVAGPANLPSGWTYASTTFANLRRTNGTGWMPVNLGSIPVTGSPLNTLPIDPINDINQAFHYTYACATSSPAGYEVNANLESRQFNKGGRDDRTSRDGGDDPNVYEVGSRLTVNPMAPIGYWALDEGTGTAIGDSSQYARNGTAISTTWLSGSANCRAGNCLSFNGSNAWVDFPQVLSTSTSSIFTFAVWHYPAGGSGTNRPTISTNGSLAQIRISSVNQNCFTNETWSQCESTTAGLNNWYFAVAVYNGASASLFVDGVLRSGPTAQTFGVAHGASLMGRNTSSGSNWMNGRIDEARIYNRALSAAEITHYYNVSR